MNINENISNYRKIAKNKGFIPTKLLISQTLVALNCQTWFLTDAKTQSFYQHANDLILIFMNINENIRKYRKTQKIKDICLQNYRYLSY